MFINITYNKRLNLLGNGLRGGRRRSINPLSMCRERRKWINQGSQKRLFPTLHPNNLQNRFLQSLFIIDFLGNSG